MLEEPHAVSGAQTERGFRMDLQGIRGFALVLVLAAHAEIPGFAGGFVGLDIFFVLSGFLITGLILREIESTGRLSLRDFYARRARRLLPLATLVLGLVAVLSVFVLDTARAHDVSADVTAAALYVSNWHFITQDIDYFAYQALTVSPVQHYWSLSVEEQFYLAWPVLVIGAFSLAARFGLASRRVLLAGLAVVGASSLTYSVLYSARAPELAYLSTLTRVWQIAAGAILALVLPAGLRLRPRLSGLVAAVGLAILLATALTYDKRLDYPGWLALLPVGATLAVMVAGTAVVASAPIRLLCVAPLQYLGRISYSWYLWHWPFLVFAAAIHGRLSVLESVAVTLAAWLPAQASHHLVEERFRRSRVLARQPRRSLALGGALTATALALALLVVVVRPGLPLAPEDAIAGARVASERTPIQKRVSEIRPAPQDATDDKGRLFDDGCLAMGKTTIARPCVYGDKRSRTTVVVLGDSHALQYFPTMLAIARQQRWRLVGLVRASCPIGDVDYQPTCNRWRANTLRRIEREEKPDLVVTSNSIDKRFRVNVGGRKLSRRASQPYLENGFARTYRRLLRTGAKVAVIRDQSPAPAGLAQCVLDNSTRLSRCAFAPRRSATLSFDARGARKASKRVTVIDPIPKLCRGRERRCPAVIGDALVYRDSQHLSATFARTLVGWLKPRLPDLR